MGYRFYLLKEKPARKDFKMNQIKEVVRWLSVECGSLFENGQPVLLEGGKIGKGADYTAPDLSRFVGGGA